VTRSGRVTVREVKKRKRKEREKGLNNYV